MERCARFSALVRGDVGALEAPVKRGDVADLVAAVMGAESSVVGSF